MCFVRLQTPLRVASNQILRCASQSAGKVLITTPKVAITDGSLNYLLVSIYIHGETLFARTLVRGHKDSHKSLFENFKNDMAEVGLCTKPLGGGMMEVNDKARTIKIKGACQVIKPFIYVNFVLLSTDIFYRLLEKRITTKQRKFSSLLRNMKTTRFRCGLN
ncbi:sex-regulated protein janus-B-like isoform X1 [Drosophila sulfurigaster albostrigata]|uniref:sex-regulated protein janus-B-like isoform X1 n=1 Tax=Drosophila sulfurigaster albostrigata TaxID=89887 RepID=UPI002D21ED2F|nr:sex-regulated protein janus-B-like isoform X1 [Drosophila sulfurigaster albostrigata]